MKLKIYHQEPPRVRVDDKTHIIVILGPDNADPGEDGWFAADFCLLNWLFTGLGKSQCWMTSIDLHDAVKQWGPILHGNPHRQRKVVLGAPNQDLHDIQRYRHLEDITLRLTQICASAFPGDTVVIIFIGHGDYTTYGLTIGEHEVLRPEVLENIITPYRSQIHLTILLTSCFSGGFVEHNNINATVLAAVRRDKYSDSLQRSGSGHYRGGLFISALTRELARCGVCRGQSYQEFTHSVDEAVELLWNLAQRPLFAVEDDEWEVEASRKLGVTFSDIYYQRLEMLPTVAPNPHPDNTTDRQWGSRIPSSQLPPQLKQLIKEYMATKPGDDCQADNNKVGSLIGMFFKGNISEKDAGRLTITLQYRIAMALVAEAFCEFLRLVKFSNFDEFSARQRHPAVAAAEFTTSRAFELVAQSGIIPQPSQGGVSRRYGKPAQYVAAAAASTPGLSEQELNARLQELRRVLYCCVP